jgi:hypothetical protein
MGKSSADVPDDGTRVDAVAGVPEKAGDPVPFVPRFDRNAPPTEAQHDWLRKNSRHARMSHAPLGRFGSRGTLHADGSFVPEGPGNPVMDGPGMFGVGIPAPR